MNDLKPAPARTTIDVLGADRDIAQAVPDDDRAEAERLLVLPSVRIEHGHPASEADAGPYGLLLVAGAVWREVVVGTTVFPQLLHPGAVLLAEPPERELLESATRAVALGSATFAVLDRRFLEAAMRWPQMANVVHRRLSEQERDLAVYAAIAGLSRVDDRLLLLLWHLAEHWGRVVPSGIRVSLRLTHATLGRFVGARRPTVSLAVAELRDQGELDRDVDGAWVLTGKPPKACDEAKARAATALPDLFPPSSRRDAA